MNRPMEPALWCGLHGRWETRPGACERAFDPDAVDWLEPTGTEHNEDP